VSWPVCHDCGCAGHRSGACPLRRGFEQALAAPSKTASAKLAPASLNDYWREAMQREIRRTENNGLTLQM